ncbi:hypothetical protein KSP39_PZI014798 [Platanthera zijinensis]|uniref:Uncharacterized protein n=1 Tax=Platanthera zijinensis TaxID=2320716 RepID=A0AAP0G273_9ASPA
MEIKRANIWSLNRSMYISSLKPELLYGVVPFNVDFVGYLSLGEEVGGTVIFKVRCIPAWGIRWESGASDSTINRHRAHRQKRQTLAVKSFNTAAALAALRQKKKSESHR